MSDDRPGFTRDVTVDDPGIIGARWWNRALADEAAAVSRRQALAALGVLGVVGAGGACLVSALGGDDTDERSERSLDAQRRYGWNLGARDQRLVFGPPGALGLTAGFAFPLGAAEAREFARELEPVTWRHAFQPTLLECPDAAPASSLTEETLPFHPLRDELVARLTASAAAARAQGEALARLLADPELRVAVVVDLPGPESVAFAAGMAARFEPVLLASNWPHPRGVVPSHLTLSAALALREVWRAARAGRVGAAPPCFILERARLLEPRSGAEFDNRYLAPLPSAAALRAAAIARVLYVVPDDTAIPELDDLNEDFCAYQAAGLEVRAVAAASFVPGPDGVVRFGGNPAAEAGFWLRYPWRPPPVEAIPSLGFITAGWRPTPRATRFDRRHAPTGFATVAIVTSGAVALGANFDRRGSWHRAGGGWSGG